MQQIDAVQGRDRAVHWAGWAPVPTSTNRSARSSRATGARLPRAATARSRGRYPEGAAAAGDIGVVTVPLRAYRDVPVTPLTGTIVIDTNSYYPQRDGSIPELDDESATTSELLQRHLPGSPVLKAFNNIFFRALGSLNRPAGAADRSALPIAGDDADAKAAVADLLARIGDDVVDVGPLAEGWRCATSGTPRRMRSSMRAPAAGRTPDPRMRTRSGRPTPRRSATAT